MRYSHKFLCGLLLLLILCIGSAYAAGLDLPETVTLSQGASYTLLKDFGADVVFSCTDSSIVFVDTNGVITGKSEGTAIVTATQGDISDQCRVTVTKADTLLIDAPSQNVYIGHPVNLTARMSSSQESVSARWKSSNTSIAKVSTGGRLVAQRPGTVTITATLADGSSASRTFNIKKASVKLSAASVTLYAGTQKTIAYTLSPADCIYDLTWTSSAANVATVKNGVITAKSAGQCTITARLSNGSSVQCKVTVKPQTLKLNKTSTTIYEGKTTTLTAKATPSDENTKITFFSSNKKVATVTGDGVVTGVAPGTATITAKLSSGLRTTCTVTVKKSDVKLNKSKATIYEGKTTTLKATILPSDGLYTSVSFYSSNKKVATVTSDGVVTGIAPGTATITAQLPSGTKTTCTVTVKKSEVKLNKSKASVYEGKTITLKATISPSDGLYTSVSFSSSNKKVATVNSDGVVTGVAPGTATISAKLPSGTKATCTVTVKKSEVKLNKTTASIYEGKTATLIATISPADGLYTSVSFYSSNKKVATVSSDGVVTGIAPGTATITAKLPSGTKVTCAVTVKKSTIAFTTGKHTVYQGQTMDLQPMIKINGARYETASGFTSSNKKVATVSRDGIVTGKSVGTATISAKLPNGSTASCTVTVKKSNVYFDSSQCAAYLGAETQLVLVVPSGSGLDSGVVYTSSDPETIQVDGQGKVRGLKEGSATIRAQVKTGAIATIHLKVQLPGVRVSESSITLYKDTKATLKAAEYPATGAHIPFDVSNSDPSVAELASDGTLKPKSVGKTTITFTHPNGNTASCQVEVRDYEVHTVTVSPASKTLYAGDDLSLSVQVLHALASDKSVVWSSSNEKIATVDQNGRVHAVGSGTCSIIAKAANGVSGSCKITVNGTTYRALALTEFGLQGMNKYMPPAQNATTNAMAALRAKGYTTYSVLSPLQKGPMMSKIASVGNMADKNDVTLIYITTHGILYNGSFYLTIPGWYESVGNMDYAISTSELVALIRQIEGHVVLCLNACNSGGFLQDAGPMLSGLDLTVICSSQSGISSGWYNGSGNQKWDFMTWGFTRAFGYNMTNGSQITLYADKNGDGCLSAQEIADYTRSYTSKMSKQYFGAGTYVGDDVPQLPQIYVTHPDQVLYEP